MLYSTEYFKLINTLSDLSSNFNNKHDEMVQSMPEKFIDSYLRKGFIDYCSRLNYRFDTSEYFNDGIFYRCINVDTLNGKFVITIAGLNKNHILSIEGLNHKKGKALNKIKVAEICYKVDDEGYISVYLEKINDKYVVIFEQYIQSKQNCNHYDLINIEKHEMSTQQVYEMFSLEMIDNANVNI